MACDLNVRATVLMAQRPLLRWEALPVSTVNNQACLRSGGVVRLQRPLAAGTLVPQGPEDSQITPSEWAWIAIFDGLPLLICAATAFLTASSASYENGTTSILKEYVETMHVQSSATPSQEPAS
jgi:hypothetical protein